MVKLGSVFFSLGVKVTSLSQNFEVWVFLGLLYKHM